MKSVQIQNLSSKKMLDEVLAVLEKEFFEVKDIND